MLLELSLLRTLQIFEQKKRTEDPREHGGRVCFCAKTKKYITTWKRFGVGKSWLVTSPECPDGWDEVGFWHSHPGMFNRNELRFSEGGDFSDDDMYFVAKGDIRNPNRLPLAMTRLFRGKAETRIYTTKGIVRKI